MTGREREEVIRGALEVDALRFAEEASTNHESDVEAILLRTAGGGPDATRRRRWWREMAAVVATVGIATLPAVASGTRAHPGPLAAATERAITAFPVDIDLESETVAVIETVGRALREGGRR